MNKTSKFTGKDLLDWFNKLETEPIEKVAASINREITGIFDYVTLKWYSKTSEIPTRKTVPNHPFRVVKATKR